MITEADLAAEVVAHLTREGWDVYQEVALLRENVDLEEDPDDLTRDCRADIVAVRGPVVCVVECKLTAGFAVLMQVKRWIPYTSRGYVAVPQAGWSLERQEFFETANDRYGAGVYDVGEEGVRLVMNAPFRPLASEGLLKSLRPEQKTFAPAGSKGGKHFTAGHGTEAALAAFVATRKGMKLEDAVQEIKHNYRSNAAAVKILKKRIKDGLVPDVVFGWRQGLYSSAEEAGKRT